MEELSPSIAARHDIEVDLQTCEECDLPLETHLALYRIAQEATNNIAKHANASSIKLILEEKRDTIQLMVADNGEGFNNNEVSPDTMGIEIMHERANSIDADLTITSQPGMGTTVSVIWPIPHNRVHTND
jgi:signal transduction histidine kinase